jgi:DNA-binding NarL/FixJ family response regulator
MRKKIVILESDRLINAGVLSFLDNQDDFDVIGLEGSEPEKIFQTIEKIRPEIIIIDQNSRILSLCNLESRFAHFSNIRTIVLNLANNQIRIWDRQHVQIHDLKDFMAVLE